MLKTVVAGVALAAAAATTLPAQDPCAAAPRELARPSPRAWLFELADSTRAVRTLHHDASRCGTSAPAWSREVEVPSLVPAHVRAWAPTARLAFIGGVADPIGSGGAWVGRGVNLMLRPAGALSIGPLHAVFAPEVWYAQNRAYDIIPSPDTARSSFASPYYRIPNSIDLPTRYGPDAVTHFAPGQSAAWISWWGADAGAATSAQQWGPGRHGGLVLGANAPGIPRLFVRTTTPVETRLGAWSGVGFIGTLSESPYFDRLRRNNLRSMAAWTIGWSPDAESPLRLGVAHASMRAGNLLAAPPWRSGPGDQLTSVFAEFGAERGAGSRVYGEVARAGQLPNLREFLTIPYDGLVYVVGLDHVIRRDRGTLLLSLEAANLEKARDRRGVRQYDFYTSRVVPQGWTHRGQVIGYPTGPGSNHASVGADWIAGGWSAGVFGERTRWNDDALYREYLPQATRHDVTMRGGVRAGYLFRGQELTLELSTGKRLNYLFQNTQFIYGYRTVDVSIPQLRLGISPQLRAHE